MNPLRIASPLAFAVAMSTAQVLAVAGHGPVWSAEYIAAYQPTFGQQGVPYAGDLSITVNNGIMTGTYTAFSNRPEPYYGRILPVTGGVSGSSVHLRFGSVSLSNGTIEKDGTIRRTVNWNGKLYNFLAKPRS